MIDVAFFVRLEAKPGKKKEEGARFLRQGLVLVHEEASTVAWIGIRLDPSPSAYSPPFLASQADNHICQELLQFLTTADHRERGRSSQQADAIFRESCVEEATQ